MENKNLKRNLKPNRLHKYNLCLKHMSKQLYISKGKLTTEPPACKTQDVQSIKNAKKTQTQLTIKNGKLVKPQRRTL